MDLLYQEVFSLRNRNLNGTERKMLKVDSSWYESYLYSVLVTSYSVSVTYRQCNQQQSILWDNSYCSSTWARIVLIQSVRTNKNPTNVGFDQG